MLTKNDPAGRYVNGTFGVIDDFDAEDGYPVVRTINPLRLLVDDNINAVSKHGRHIEN